LPIDTDREKEEAAESLDEEVNDVIIKEKILKAIDLNEDEIDKAEAVCLRDAIE
jgi:hypothetical protein